MRIPLIFVLLLPMAVWAQPQGTDLTGSWEAETPEGPQTLVVRADSTVSFGEEVVRWRVNADTILILLGEDWLGYNFVLDGDLLTLSGGDLLDPVTLKRVGPPDRLVRSIYRHTQKRWPVRGPRDERT